jgi:hypothetical protein
LPLGRGGFGHQMIRTLGFEKLRAHRSRSSHQSVRLVNPKLWTSISHDMAYEISSAVSPGYGDQSLSFILMLPRLP